MDKQNLLDRTIHSVLLFNIEGTCVYKKLFELEKNEDINSTKYIFHINSTNIPTRSVVVFNKNVLVPEEVKSATEQQGLFMVASDDLTKESYFIEYLDKLSEFVDLEFFTSTEFFKHFFPKVSLSLAPAQKKQDIISNIKKDIYSSFSDSSINTGDIFKRLYLNSNDFQISEKVTHDNIISALNNNNFIELDLISLVYDIFDSKVVVISNDSSFNDSLTEDSKKEIFDNVAYSCFLIKVMASDADFTVANKKCFMISDSAEDYFNKMNIELEQQKKAYRELKENYKNIINSPPDYKTMWKELFSVKDFLFFFLKKP